MKMTNWLLPVLVRPVRSSPSNWPIGPKVRRPTRKMPVMPDCQYNPGHDWEELPVGSEPDVCSVLELLCNPHFVHNAILMLMNNFVIMSSDLQLQLLDTQVKRGLIPGGELDKVAGENAGLPRHIVRVLRKHLV